MDDSDIIFGIETGTNTVQKLDEYFMNHDFIVLDNSNINIIRNYFIIKFLDILLLNYSSYFDYIDYINNLIYLKIDIYYEIDIIFHINRNICILLLINRSNHTIAIRKNIINSFIKIMEKIHLLCFELCKYKILLNN